MTVNEKLKRATQESQRYYYKIKNAQKMIVEM